MFNSAKRKAAFTNILAGCAKAYRVKVLAWALLPKSVYLVVIPPSAEALSSFMRVVQTRFARHLHATGFTGEVTPRRFASCPLDNRAALEAIKYVETRPVSEGLAKAPFDYQYSSAAVRAGKAKVEDNLPAAVAAITGKVACWDEFHGKPLPRERAEHLAMRMRTGKPAGSADFIRRVEREVGMNLSRRRGRPKSA